VKSLRLASLTLAGVLLLPACAPRATLMPEPSPGPVFLSEQEVTAVAALLRMEDGRTFDARLVQRLLEHDTPEVRGRAALAAGRVRDPRAVPMLLASLQDADATVRARAAFALGVMADSTSDVIAALGSVALEDAAAPAAEAVAALGKLGLEQGRAAVDSLLARDGAPATVRQEALLAAWRLRRAPSTSALVQRWIADPDPETRWRAAYALMRVAGPAGVPALIEALHDPDDRVRASAARALRAPVADSAGLRARAYEAALQAAAGDPHPHVRINALRVLPSYRDSDRTTPVLLARLREEDVNVAVAAAQALSESADRAASGTLRDIAADPGRADGLRSAALSALMRLEPGFALPTALEWTDSARWILRFHAARALGSAAWDAAAAPLQRLARDPHPVVAAEALASTRAAADSLAPPRHVFVEALGARHPLVRAAAVRGLARHGSPADLDILLEAWDRARHDEMHDAAIATIEALGGLARSGVPVARSFFLRFGRHGAPPDPAVHRAIATHIGEPPAQWGEPASGAQPQSQAFYEDIVLRYVAPVLAGDEMPAVLIATQHGEIVLELAAAEAPLTVHNFLTLVERGYYAATRWHRVVPNFVIQDGDPRGDGSGGPGYAIRDEINRLRYTRGVLGMALSGPDTGGSQFFITHSPQPHLDGGYTIFGRVLEGMAAVDRVVQDEPILGFRRLR
jgi:cyclophilin family peptidyl-prolyl cis-trans isomerase/HEAT repeat protein